MSRRVQQGWDAVRSQVMAQLARCDTPRDEQVLTAEERHIFRAGDAEPYYGPTRDARAAVNRIVGLGASAGQLEWEAELGRDGKVDRLIDALADASLDTEARSAVALLLLDSAELLRTELLARIRWHLRADARVQARMRYWWTHMKGNGAVMEALS
jgi:hypothetical protein